MVNVVSPLVIAVGTAPLVSPELVHDGLEDRGEGGHPDASGNQDGMLCPEDV